MRCKSFIAVALVVGLFSVVTATQVQVHHEHSVHEASLLQMQARVLAVMKGTSEDDAIPSGLLKRLYMKMDEDSDNKVSMSEFVAVFSKFVSRKEAKTFFHMFTGGKAKLTLKDFVGFFTDDNGTEPVNTEEQPASPSTTESTPSTEDSSSTEASSSTTSGSSSTKGVIDFLKERNLKAHHTAPYAEFHIKGKTKLVVRRGQDVHLRVTFPEGQTSDGTDITFKIGTTVAKKFGTKSFKSLEWGAKPASAKGRVVTMRLWIPADAMTGTWSLKLVIGEKITDVGEIIVLFNPWSKFDDVYLPDPKLRQEYVMEKAGHLYQGDGTNPDGSGIFVKTWQFHQFELLDVVLEVQDLIPTKHHGDPVLLSRYFTRYLNSNTKHGMLVGRWEADFPNGTHPSDWVGSRKIFQQWLANGKKKVKYGQCWVFAGLLTTAMRALGIPCRPVTTFRSAHDSQPYDFVIEEAKGESIWNYHVWNEAWMHRRDMNIEKPSWSAIDATPQEESNGEMQCGPAELSHVVRNDVKKDYDVDFVVGEVKAHKWLLSEDYKPGKKMTSTEVDTDDVGRMISTKKVGCTTADMSCREDITSIYKIDSDPFKLHDARFKEVEKHHFKVETSKTNRVGDAFSFTLTSKQTLMKEDASMHIVMKAEAALYNGVSIATVKALEDTCSTKAGSKSSCDKGKWTITVDPKDYQPHLGTTGCYKLSAHVKNHDKSQDRIPDYIWEHDLCLKMPSLQVETDPKEVAVGKSFKLKMHFTNPLDIELTGIRVDMDSEDIDRRAKFEGPIKPKAKVLLISSDLKTSEEGEQSISLAFVTDQLGAIQGDVSFVAKTNKENEQFVLDVQRPARK